MGEEHASGPIVRLNDVQAALYVATHLIRGADYNADYEEIKMATRAKFDPTLTDPDLFSLSQAFAELIHSTR
jgi:hypothetical protein